MATETDNLALVIDADLKEVRRLGPWLLSLFSPDVALCDRLELALHELCVNIIDHAYQGNQGKIFLQASLAPDQAYFEIHDDGEPFDESLAPQPEPGTPQIRGYGLMIVKRLVDELVYQRTGNSNRWQVKVNRSQ